MTRYAPFDGLPFRILIVVDCHSRGSLAIVPRMYFRACQVVEILERPVGERGKPRSLRCDNGPEIEGWRCQDTLA